MTDAEIARVYKLLYEHAAAGRDALLKIIEELIEERK